MKRDNSTYLNHILDAILKIEEYLKDVSQDVFYNNTLIQDGVIRQIEIIGEAVKNLSDDLRKKHTRVPWRDIAGMRDKLIHEYFGVDIIAVWLTAKNDIPVLKTEITNISR